MRNILVAVLLTLFMASLTAAQGVDPGRNRNGNCCNQIKGEITSIDAVNMQIVVETVTVQVTPNTVILKKKMPIKFEDLEVGMYVCVMGKYDKNVFVASRICVMDCGGGCGDIQGEITSIDPVNLQIVVDDVTVQVTSTTIIKQKCKQISFDDLKVGMEVCVQGEYQGNILVATVITVKGGCGGGGG